MNDFHYTKELLCQMNVDELGILLSCLLPLVKLGESDNKYLIGATKRTLIVRQDRIIVQNTSSGEDLKDFISRYSLSECLVIWRMMQEKNLSYRDVVTNLLQIKDATPMVIAKYQANVSEEVSQIFEVIATIIREK